MEIERQLDVLIRARYPIIYIVSYEEDRVTACLHGIAQRWNKKLHVWSVVRGMVPFEKGGADTATRDPGKALEFVESSQSPGLFVFRDFDAYLSEPRLQRHLRELASSLKVSHKTLIIVAPTLKLPCSLEKDVTVVDFQLPTFAELNALLDQMVAEVRDNPSVRIDLPGDTKEELVKAALGLTRTEAENAFAKALVLDSALDASDIDVILSEKQQVIRKTGLLEYYEADEQWGEVGGLELLKEWLLKRRLAFNERAREFGLPQPKGILLLGVQGCGKSLVAKAVAGLWRLPLLRLDLGSVFSGLVGSSEENMRRAIRTAEGVSPCILWLDELEKGLSGMTGGHSDGGTAARVFGSFLTWLQEKTAPVFVIATANNVHQLPPEVLRKGRFDEIFFVDLPGEGERAEIFRIHLRKRKRDPNRFDLEGLVATSQGFSGAEIEQAVIAGLYDAFEQDRDLATADVQNALTQTIPLSKMMSEEIDALVRWARHRARAASATEVAGTVGARRLEFGEPVRYNEGS